MPICSQVRSLFRDFYSIPSFNSVVHFERGVHRFFFGASETAVEETAKKLIDANVHRFICDSGGLTDYKKSLVEPKGFTPLTHSVLSHPSLNGWLIKCGPRDKHYGPLTPSGVMNAAGNMYTNAYSNLLRVFMAERMQKVIEDEGLDEIVIPEKKVMRSHLVTDLSLCHKSLFFDHYFPADLSEKYYIFAKRVDVLNWSETEKALSAMPEDRLRKIARQICTLIRKSGFADAHSNNIRLTRDLRKVVILDTEPHGTMRETTDRSPNCTLSHDRCALIGLREFSWRFKDVSAIIPEEAERTSAEIRSTIFWRRFKIVLSILIPVIPIVLLILGIIKKPTPQRPG